MVRLILEDEKLKDRKLVVKADKFKEHFSGYSIEEAEFIIGEVLDEWKKRKSSITFK